MGKVLWSGAFQITRGHVLVILGHVTVGPCGSMPQDSVCLTVLSPYSKQQWMMVLITVLTHQFLEIVSKLFCAILYTYSGVCSMLVPQFFLCCASQMGENTFIDCFASIRGNILELRINIFGPCSIHAIVQGITFLTIRAFAMTDSIFDVVITHKYGHSGWHRRNLGILIADPDSPQKMRPDDV